MQFLNPALLAGTALFVVPLVIHLLNRQRHRRRPWAAMEFLLRAYQKQRNRLRNENLLLLLLRCLVPIVLALAVARPVLRSAAGLLGGSSIAHHVVVLDGSYSMAAHLEASPAAFERARTLVLRLLERLEGKAERNDKVTLVLAGVRPRFLVRGDLDLASARAQWLSLQRPEDAASDLTDALTQVADALDEGGDGDVQVYVLSDLQVRSFGSSAFEPARAEPARPKAAAAAPLAAGAEPAAGDAELHDTVRDVVERLQKRPGTQLHWIDTGPFAERQGGGTADNVQVTELRIEQPAAVARTPVDLVATLRNRAQTQVTAEVTLDVDGGEPMRKVVTLPAGADGEADFQVSFRELGKRKLRVSLQHDALEADDERFAIVDVRERIRVLLVDGAADEDPALSYRALWQSRLDPDPATLPTFAVEAVDTLALLGGQASPLAYDVTVLAAVDRLNQRAADALAQALQAGKGLLVAYGPRTDAQSFNLHLHAAGTGPQPFRLLREQGGASGSSVARTPTIALPDHALLREFAEPVYREILQSVPVWRWFAVDPKTLAEGTQVVATLTDAAQSPLLVARSFGLGRAAFLTSPPQSEYRVERWNRFDDPWVAYPLLFGLAQWLALPAEDPFHAVVGATLTCSLAGRPENVEVQRPDRDGDARVPVGEETRPLPSGRFTLPALTNTVYAGFYTFELLLDRDAAKEHVSLPFAVNVDPEEGDLRYAAHADVRQALGLERVLTALPAEGEALQETEQSELGPSLLLATLLFVLAEAALARFVSVRRS